MNTMHKRTGQKESLIALTIVLSFTGLAYIGTLSSMVQIWSDIDAFRHGFLIAPISIYLVYEKLPALRTQEFTLWNKGILLIFALSTMWWASEFLGIQVGMHFFFVAIIAGVVITIVGREKLGLLVFPLGFLFFAIPFGEFLIPFFMDVTAYLATNILRFLNIPVYRDATFFHIPTGSYEVAAACSGIRYVLATLCLTTLHSHWIFRSHIKKLFYVAFAVGLAVLANGIRAATVVLLLHFTDLNIAAGEDHEFVGWITYGLLFVFLLGVGAKFGDNAHQEYSTAETLEIGDATEPAQGTVLRWSKIALLILAISAGPLLANATKVHEANANEDRVFRSLPSSVSGWVASQSEDLGRRPVFIGYAHISFGRYSNANGIVDVAVIRYREQRQGHELANSSNSVVDTEKWRIAAERDVVVEVDKAMSLIVKEVQVRRAGESRVIWHWNEVNGNPVQGTLRTKAAELRNLLTRTPNDSSAIIISTDFRNSRTDSRLVLERFIRVFYPQLEECMDTQPTSSNCELGSTDD